MGYRVNTIKSNLTLKASVLDEIFTIFKQLNAPEYDKYKGGSSFSGGKKNESWYSWMPSDYDQTAENAAEILEMIGFEFMVDDSGNLYNLTYDSKSGEEEHFFSHIAHLIEKGQYVYWIGEDDSMWYWYFDGQHLQNLENLPTERKMSNKNKFDI